MLSRRAATLVELLVSLILASVVLGAATASVLRQQRTHARVDDIVSADVQLRTATTVLANQLSFIDAPAGDIPVGEAQDTALQFRATIAAAIACAPGIGSVTFLPERAGTVPMSGLTSDPRLGDTLWFLGDSAWRGVRIEGAPLTLPASGIRNGAREV